MNVILFGATGMVGQGVLREALAAADVDRVLSVGRSPTGVSHPRLSEIVLPDPGRLEGYGAALRGYDAALFCLGVSSAGMDEAAYTRVTYDLTLSAASRLARLNPQMTFVYVSGMGTDATERGRAMWARVKGRTENALRRLPFRAVYLFRPGAIQPVDGIRSRTAWYRLFYTLAWPLLTPLRLLAPGLVLTTRSLGRAMLEAARHGAAKAVLESRDIAALAGREAAHA
jgi:uncharacterized protein YbjT (DUF2867 family)